jgi:hypothetical protein
MWDKIFTNLTEVVRESANWTNLAESTDDWQALVGINGNYFISFPNILRFLNILETSFSGI